jgi:hypothetical protein
MQKVKIGHREVILAPKYLQARKLNRKYGLESGLVITGEEFNSFCIDAVWMAIKRNRIFKPFITKRRMIKQMTPWDMERFRAMFDWVYSGKIFTEDELQARVDETKRKLAEEAKKAVEKAVSEYTETSVEDASNELKKK